jgi:hypothetical protein
MNDAITIFLFVVFLGIGAAVGYLVTNLRRHTPPPPPGEPTHAPEGSVEILRVWRTAEGQVRLGMDDQALENANALSAEQRRRLVKLVIDLRPWLEASSEGIPAREAAVQPAAPAAKEVKKPEEKPAVPPPVVIKTIVQQIDEVLQAKLEGTPLKGRDIELTDGPLGAVIVRIGLNKYDGIDAVPEPEVKALIRQAVSDWEKGSK